MGRRATYTRLDEHPWARDVTAILARVPHLTDEELRGLAAAWRNTHAAASARRRALSPDTLLVVDVLRAFDDIAALYGEDLDGEAGYLVVEAGVVSVALKAMRDAVAGTFARPMLSRGDYAALTAPWSSAIDGAGRRTPNLGPAPLQVQALLDAFSGLSGRCHDATRRQTWDGLVVRAMTVDEGARDAAVAEAHAAAVVAGRRRLWALLRRTATHHPARRCAACSRPPAYPTAGYDEERVTVLAADAACALLVSDLLAPATLDTLLAPLSGLVPVPRPAAEA